jgi:hypothetical protein
MANKDYRSKVLLDFFSVRLFLHDIFLKFEVLARYFLGDSTHPPTHKKSNGPSLIPKGCHFYSLFHARGMSSGGWQISNIFRTRSSCEKCLAGIEHKSQSSYIISTIFINMFITAAVVYIHLIISIFVLYLETLQGNGI